MLKGVQTSFGNTIVEIWIRSLCKIGRLMTLHNSREPGSIQRLGTSHSSQTEGAKRLMNLVAALVNSVSDGYDHCILNKNITANSRVTGCWKSILGQTQQPETVYT